MKLFFKLYHSNFLLLLFLVPVSASCTDNETKQVHRYIGLYEITNRLCQVEAPHLEECKTTKFIELVKGQFFGVKNDEVAVVFWRGNKGEELLYQARKIEKKYLSQISDGKIVLLNNDTGKEIIKLVNGHAIEYNFILAKSSNKDKKIKTQYILKPAKRGLLPEYRMNYPGND